MTKRNPFGPGGSNGPIGEGLSAKVSLDERMSNRFDGNARPTQAHDLLERDRLHCLMALQSVGAASRSGPLLFTNLGSPVYRLQSGRVHGSACRLKWA